MAFETSITCDICKKKKEQVNHWKTVWIGKSDTFHSIEGVSKSSSSLKYPRKHVCGVEHALTMYNRYLSHGTLEMEAPPQEGTSAS